MRLAAPRVPPAASAAFGATVGPRVLPGTYTVKLTKDTATYTTQLVLIPDPRGTHTQEERQAALNLALKISGTLTDMTFAVERMNGMRQALDDRAGKLPANDGLTRRLRTASGVVDSLRKKIVATKEGGMITGEERLRENLTDLYGNIVFYDGGPTQTETSTESKHNLHGDVVTCSFDVTQTSPEGTFRLFGTATGFFTPAS